MTPQVAQEELLQRIKREFIEMPGLRVTGQQARRLWDLDDSTCEALLATLVSDRFLFQTRDGAYMRIERGQLNPVATSRNSARVA